MYKAVVAEHDAPVRSMLLDMLSWKAYQFELVPELDTPRRIRDALLAGTHKKIDFILLDMQESPDDVLELLVFLYARGIHPIIYVLCDYGDIHLMRNAFRYGAVSYIFKPELSRSLLRRQLQSVSQLLSARDWNESLFGGLAEKELARVLKRADDAAAFIPGRQGRMLSHRASALLAAAARGDQAAAQAFLSAAGSPAQYAVAAFEIDAFCRDTDRFKDNIALSLVQPLCGFVSELPCMRSCVFASVSAERYVLFCPIGPGSAAQESVRSICRSMQELWLTYMNLSVTAGISRPAHGEADFYAACREAFGRTGMKFVLGFTGIYTEDDDCKLSITDAENASERYGGLCQALKTMDRALITQMQEAIITGFYIRPLDEAKKECLYIIYQVAVLLRQYNIDFWKLFQKEDNYYARIMQLDSMEALERWVSYYLRGLLDYMKEQQERHQEDSLHQALMFVAENFMDPGISCSSVAAFIGMDERIFMTRFARMTGLAFHNYIISLRIARARELLAETALSLSQISVTVGFNSVEHFCRLFQKVTGVSPETFRKTPAA